MGLMSGRIDEAFAGEARKAYDDGLPVFTTRLTVPRLVHTRQGYAGWAEIIAAIEAAGWRLEHWDVATKGNDAEAYPVFRRA